MRRLRPAFVVLFLVVAIQAAAQRVIVFPLDQLDSLPSGGWIGTGLAVGLNEALARGKIPFIPFDGLQRVYDQEGLVNSPSFSLPSQVALARQLGAAYFVQGSYRISGDDLSVEVSAYDLSGDLKTLGSWKEKSKLSQLLGLTESLAKHLFAVFGKPWKKGEEVSPAAFESYIRGRISSDSLVREVYFRKAVELAPAYNNARCRLALVLKQAGHYSEAASILKGLEDKHFTTAYLALDALGQLRMREGRLKEARTLFLRSLNASENPDAHIGLAKLYILEDKVSEAKKELLVAERFETRQDEIDALRAKLALKQKKKKVSAKSGGKKTPTKAGKPGAGA